MRIDLKGYVEIEKLDKRGNVVGKKIEDGSNLILNNMRSTLPLLFAPRIVTGRVDNSAGLDSWLDRRVALLGFGAGDAGDPPTVKPEEPEDGRTILVGELDFPNSKQALQSPMRRIPQTPSGPSELHTAASPIHSYHLLKELDPDGFSIAQISLGGAEARFVFTIEEDEYIGNIMEYTLYLGGGDAADDSTFDIGSGNFERRRLDRANAIPVARKTRTKPLEKTRDFKFRLTWRIRT